MNTLRRRAWIVSGLFLLVALSASWAGAQTTDEEQLRFWLPEGARIVQRLTLPHNIVTRVTAPSSPEDVVAFYTQRFEEDGWTLVSTFEMEGAYTLFAIKGRRDATLTIEPDGDGGSRVRASVSRTEWQRIEPEAPPRR